MKTCETCECWGDAAEIGGRRRACMGIPFDDRVLSLHNGEWVHPILITAADFGCVLWEKRNEALGALPTQQLQMGRCEAVG